MGKHSKTIQPKEEQVVEEKEDHVKEALNVFGQLSIGDYSQLTGRTSVFLSGEDKKTIEGIMTETKEKGYTIMVIPISLLSEKTQEIGVDSLRLPILKEVESYCTLRTNGNRKGFSKVKPQPTFRKRGVNYTVLNKGGYKFLPELWVKESDKSDTATLSGIVDLDK